MKYRTYLTLGIICILGLITPELHAQDIVLEKIVAKVGDELLLQSEIDQTVAYQSERFGGEMTEELKCAIVDDLLTTKLLIAQAAVDSIVVSDEEVNAELQRKIDYILGLMNNDVQVFRETYGKSVSEVRSAFREDLKKQKTAEAMQRNIMTNIRVTPSEVLEFYDNIPKDSLPYFNSEVEVGEIMYVPEPNQEEKRKALELLEQIRERIIVNNESFDDLAKKFSDDPGSGRQGGYLGWNSRGSFVPEFEAVAFSLEPNEVSEIVETDFGYHIIKLLERRGNSILTKHILIIPEVTEADVALAKLRLDSIVNLIKVDSMPFERAVREFSEEDAQSYNNGGRMINPKTGKTFFETPELDPGIFFGIDTIEVGEITAPILFSNGRQGSFYRIIKLFSRTKPHQADLTLDYSKIKDAAIAQQRESHLSKWKKDTMRSTYIQLDEKYFADLQCPLIQEWQRVAD